MITLAQLQKVFPSTPAKTLSPYVDALNKTFSKYAIITKSRQAMFLAQIGHESAGLTAVRENLNYSADALCRVFPKYFNRGTAAQCARKPEMIANIVYANRMSNGCTASGDGWTYRGRGAIQITGKANYTALAKALGMDLNAVVAYLETAEGAIVSAGWYWNANNLNKYSDLGDIVTTTKKINGGTNGLEDRKAIYARALRTL